MATALVRKANHLRNAYRSSCYHSVSSQFRSSPTLSSPLLNDRRHLLPSDMPLGSIVYRSITYSLHLCSRLGPESSSEQAKPDGGDKPESAKNGGEAKSDGVEKAESSKNGGDGKSDGGEKSGGSQQGNGARKSDRRGPVSWLSFLLLAATGAGIIWYYDDKKKRHIEGINKASEAVKEGPSAGKAEIGGPFNLVDHNGKQVTEKDFKGKWTVIYFGFTHCPDICPDELQKLVTAVDKIKEKEGFEIVPVFISVDPERDSVEQVREYVKEFHPKLVGVTGNPDEVKKAARAYRVYYMKTVEEDSDYLVDHSIVMYLMDPNMDYVKFFGKNNDVDSLSDGIIKEIKQYKSKK
ncbi:Protein SCO1 1, mitochondrial [Turnera subulata]|uniref:Protein SCO1 1, mitochondrial n=1 Tax=Turnera subulata TaxID=218843 RepID=A0A9Q0JEG9_9ROSI|nr:Protein SCO1 1, mitochondrial [Turnera subulata]